MAMTRLSFPDERRKWGRIVYISSVMGLASKAARNSYSATKSAVIGLARAQCGSTLGEHGITANYIPRPVYSTDLPMSVLSETEKKASPSRPAVNRWGDPKELTGAPCLLSSDAGSYIYRHHDRRRRRHAGEAVVARPTPSASDNPRHSKYAAAASAPPAAAAARVSALHG